MLQAQTKTPAMIPPISSERYRKNKLNLSIDCYVAYLASDVELNSDEPFMDHQRDRPQRRGFRGTAENAKTKICMRYDFMHTYR